MLRCILYTSLVSNPDSKGNQTMHKQQKKRLDQLRKSSLK